MNKDQAMRVIADRCDRDPELAEASCYLIDLMASQYCQLVSRMLINNETAIEYLRFSEVG